MKKLLFMAFATLLSMHAIAQGYHITGDVTGVPDGKKLYLTLVLPSYTDVDSVILNNGHFEFNGKHVEGPKWALVRIEKQFSPLADFYLEDGDISIQGTRYDTKAKGTPTNSQYKIYNDSIVSLYTKESEYRTVMAMDESKKDSCMTGIENLRKELLKREMSFISRYPDSPIALRVADYGTRRLGSSDMLRMLHALSPRLQQDESVRKNIEIAKALVKTEPGAQAPNFTLADSTGQQVSLNSFLGKYVLIDFWASWCHPCRASFPAIAALYEKYRAKGLEVLGVSLDRSAHAWRKALDEEKAPWVMVHDQKGTVAADYAVKTIPLLVLVDKQGKVVGRYSAQDMAEVLGKLL